VVRRRRVRPPRLLRRHRKAFFLNRSTGSVWYFADTGVEWWMSSVFEKAGDDFTTFFLEWVSGPGYLRLTGSEPEEQWPELLTLVGRLRG
jgi:hypothetical protein